MSLTLPRLAVASVVLASLAHAAPAFDLEGHRGARGLAPENTLAAFRIAIDVGVTTIESDLGVTRDGVVVIAHDRDLNPAIVRDASGRWLAGRGPPIHALSLAELRAYDIGRLDPKSAYAKQLPAQRAADGERFPTLHELLALAKPTPLRVDIETKISPTTNDTVDPQAFAQLVIDRLRAADMLARATLQSFDWRTLVAAKKIAPQIETACLTYDDARWGNMTPDASGRSPWHAGLALADYGGSLPKLVEAAGCAVWSANSASITRERVDEAHARGIRVLAWTVNEPVEMNRLIDAGVDGLITDYPDRAAKLLAERGIRWR